MDRLKPIDVRRYGSAGSEVVVLHGGPGAPGSAAELAILLASECSIWEPLQRRSGTTPLTVARHVEDVATVAPARAAVVGWSWGAMLGLSFAARHPDRVSRLALVGCGTYDERCRAEFHRRLDRLLDDGQRRRLLAIQERLIAEQEPRLRDRFMGEIGSILASVETYESLLDTAAATNPIPADAAGHQETWDDVQRLQRLGIEPAAFSAIQCPVLMLHGDADPHPGACTRDTLRKHIPQLEYVELPRCGHEPWRERYARAPFARVLGEWLRSGRLAHLGECGDEQIPESANRVDVDPLVG